MEATRSVSSRQSAEEFFENREALIARERQNRSDYAFRQSLSPAAKEACSIVSSIRDEERRTIWKTEGNPDLGQKEIFPGMMFNDAKDHMESSKLWQIVRKMPKGALLHAHLGATVELDWVFNLALSTPGMHMSAPIPLSSESGRETSLIAFQYSGLPFKDVPSIWSPGYPPNTLVPIKVAAETFPNGGQKGFVLWLIDRCSITQSESLQHHLGVNDVWRKLQMAFLIVGPLIYYEPILRAFIQKLLLTLKEDGIRWLEGRTLFTTAFTLEGQETSTRSAMELCGVLDEEVEKFMATDEGKDFWGVRFIWTSLRGQDSATLIEDMRLCVQAKKRYPKFIEGYDLVGPEDLGRTLHDLTPEILWFQEECAREGVDIPFFFHAGECLGDGDETDNNLFDAILFGTRRIGHAFSLYKHPLLIDIVKEKKILVESCPISNEVLRYTASILSHPLPALLSRGVAAALSNDDPALLGQGTSGLTHDFWQALQGWENLGLEGLGSLAQNSVRWSVFEDQTTEDWLKTIEEGSAGTGIRAKRMQEWNAQWEEFCHWVIKEFGGKCANS